MGTIWIKKSRKQQIIPWCECTWKVISNSSDVDFIHSDIHGLSHKKSTVACLAITSWLEKGHTCYILWTLILIIWFKWLLTENLPWFWLFDLSDCSLRKVNVILKMWFSNIYQEYFRCIEMVPGCCIDELTLDHVMPWCCHATNICLILCGQGIRPQKLNEYTQISNIRHISRQQNCWSLRCSWSSVCWRCLNYMFILDSTPGFNGLGKVLQDEISNI